MINTRSIGADETTSMGTPAELAAAVASERRVPLRWYGHASTPTTGNTDLAMEFLPDLASARYLVWMVGNDGPAEACPDVLAIDALLRFETADGVFQDRFPGALRKEANFGMVSFEGTLAAAALQGTYDDAAIVAGFVNPMYILRTTVSSEPRGNLQMTGGDPDNNPNTIKSTPAVADWPVGSAQ